MCIHREGIKERPDRRGRLWETLGEFRVDLPALVLWDRGAGVCWGRRAVDIVTTVMMGACSGLGETEVE